MGYEEFGAHTVDIAAEGDAVTRRTIVEAVGLAGQVARSIAGEEPDLSAQGLEDSWETSGAKIALTENHEARPGELEVIWDAELERVGEVIGDEPAAQVHRVGSWVKKFESKSLRQGIDAR